MRPEQKASAGWAVAGWVLFLIPIGVLVTPFIGWYLFRNGREINGALMLAADMVIGALVVLALAGAL